MSHAAVSINGGMLLLGGDDGGHLDGDGRDYSVNGLSDAWFLDIAGTEPRWRELQATNVVPPGRCHHSAALIHNSVVVYGGMHRGDVWVAKLHDDAHSLSWSELEPSGPRPGIRHGHTIAKDPQGAGFYVLGGFRFAADAETGDGLRSEHGPLSDLWHLSMDGEGVWRHVEGGEHPLGGRTYASMFTLGPELIVWAGAACRGSCKCYSDVSAFSTEDQDSGWRTLDVVEAPIARYKQAAVFVGDSLYTTGGESYKPYSTSSLHVISHLIPR